MTLRARIVGAGVLVAVVPLAVFAVGLRGFVTGQVQAQYQRRVAERVEAVQADVARQAGEVGARLRSLAGEVRADNALRALLTVGGADRAYLVNYGERALGLSGLSVLRLQDEEGRILTSGHFRNEFDRLDPVTARVLRDLGGPAVARMPAAEGGVFALMAIDSVSLGSSQFFLLGGSPVRFGGDAERGGSDVRTTVALPGVPAGEGAGSLAVTAFELPFIDETTTARGDSVAVISVLHDDADLVALRATMDRWFFIAAAASVVFGLAIAVWLAGVITRPLMRLAEQTGRIDLDRLNVGFASERQDEVGALSRLLGAMTDRLRSSRSRLQEAERRATMGELARQVNHDIKNGLVPIRNVVRHLSEVAAADPGGLATVYDERSATLDASIEYLETLSANYARLSPDSVPKRTALNPLLKAVIGRVAHRDGVQVVVALEEPSPVVDVDPLMLRRVIDNILSNAVDAIGPAGGQVTVTTEVRAGGLVGIAVRDTGRGMTEEEFNRAFDDFYSTKNGGTGLGLSIVRRLVADMHGSVKIQTQPGTGTNVTVELPAAGGVSA